MKRHIVLLVLVIMFYSFVEAQTTSTKYYKDKYLSKEVPKDKANYLKLFIKNEDGSITTKTVRIDNEEVIESSTYKDGEPISIWKLQRSDGIKEMDYGFKLVYSDTTCNDSIEGVIIEDYFSNYQEIGYIAPKISTGEMTLHQFIGQNIEYPRLAREQGIMGVVYVSFMILSTGEIDNIKIKRGKNIFLDKEAVRVIRKLKFSSPPTYKGIPYKICLTIPITFKMT